MESKKKGSKSPAKVQQKTGSDVKPKRPANAYFRYQSAVREQMQKEHPGLKASELAKFIGAEYAKLTEKEKEPYQSAYDKENEAFKPILEAWKSKYGDQEVKTKKRNEKSQSPGKKSPGKKKVAKN